uniref:Uncharacterized protein n=1 Tax=Siphoviridae sp. ct0X023 TaxID=2825295 RepID=A0A8S5P0V0_9CAUD|nr:MAG TPA: hypothetical protein [Siphoviridae sp. ct0X023]
MCSYCLNSCAFRLIILEDKSCEATILLCLNS